MCAKIKQEAQNPLILRCHRLMEAFAKSNDERDFYIDRLEGFLIYADLDKSQPELEALETELKGNADRYCQIPKLSFFETKKIMEGFVNEKVYDIDTKEKLLDIIQSKEARENFLEFIYDHHAEQEKWQQFYQERSRIRIIEWLRQNHFHFVFEEDLDLPRTLIEKLKQSLFQAKVGKDIQNARKALYAKAKTYYSNEALNPRPKRGRPPKQAIKPDIEPQVTIDVYTTVQLPVRPFLFSPEMNASSAFSVFSSKFESEEELLVKNRQQLGDTEASLNQKLASLRALSNRWVENAPADPTYKRPSLEPIDDEDDEEDDEEDDDYIDQHLGDSRPKKPTAGVQAKQKKKKPVLAKAHSKADSKTNKGKTPSSIKGAASAKSAKSKGKRIMAVNPTKNQTPKKKPLKKIVQKSAKH